MINLRWLSGSDSIDQKDINEMLFENGIDFDTMVLNYHNPVCESDIGYYSIIPKEIEVGNRNHSIKNGTDPLMENYLPAIEYDYDNSFDKSSISDKIQISKEWAFKTGKPYDDTKLNSYGDNQLVIMYLLYHGKLEQTHDNISKVHELYDYLLDCYKDRTYTDLLRIRRKIKRFNHVLEGKKIFVGGRINDDITNPDTAYSQNKSIFLQTGIDIARCYRYSDSVKDMYDRVMFMLDRFRSTYSKDINISSIIEHCDIRSYVAIKYFIGALYYASKFMWNHHAEYEGFPQIDLIYYEHGISYGSIQFERQVGISRITPFFRVMDASNVDINFEFLGPSVYEGGLSENDVKFPDSGFMWDVPIYVNTSLDIADCCKFTDSEYSIVSRVNKLLYRISKYGSSMETDFVGNVTNKKWFRVYRYVVGALYIASKKVHETFHDDAIELSIIRNGFLYPYCENDTLIPFYKLIDSKYNLLFDFLDRK